MQNQVYFNNVEMAQEQASENAQRVARPRRVRTSFTSFQLSKLEETFKKMPVITRTVRYSLSLELNLQEKQIKIWFQNRRMKEKKENARVAASLATAMNSPPMLDQNLVYQNQLIQMPSTSWYNQNSSTIMNQNLVYQGNVQPYSASNSPHQQINYENINLPGPSSSYNSSPTDQSAGISISPSSYNSNSPLSLDQNLVYQNNFIQMPSTSWYNSNSSQTMDQNLGYPSNVLQYLASNSPHQQISSENIYLPGPSPPSDQSAVKVTSPSSCDSNSPPLNQSGYQFNDINTSSEEQQTYSDEINYYEIQQILGDIF